MHSKARLLACRHGIGVCCAIGRMQHTTTITSKRIKKKMLEERRMVTSNQSGQHYDPRTNCCSHKTEEAEKKKSDRPRVMTPFLCHPRTNERTDERTMKQKMTTLNRCLIVFTFRSCQLASVADAKRVSVKCTAIRLPRATTSASSMYS